jgi:hypothetical protein
VKAKLHFAALSKKHKSSAAEAASLLRIFPPVTKINSSLIHLSGKLHLLIFYILESFLF